VSESDVETAVRIFGDAVGAVSQDPGQALHDARKWGAVDEVYVGG
jgi:hypothetical protein